MRLDSSLVTGAFLALLPIAEAQTVGGCPSEMKTYRDVIACAETRSPEARLAIADLERAKAEVLAAGQWRNPEFSATSVYGRANGQSSYQTDLDLGVPIELGGKISSRKKVAEGGVAQSEARAFEAKVKIRTEVLLKLHRLRQLLHEQEVIEESVGTFEKLVNQFSRRPKLSPEQQLSYSVFRMSKSEYEIRRAETLEETASLRAYFKVAVGKEIEELKKAVPESPKSWPDLGGGYRFGSSPKAKQVHADLQAAQASLSLARSEAWPTLTLGPSIQLENLEGQAVQMYGLNMSLPIPLFNLNGGGRAAAASGVAFSEAKRFYAQAEEERERESLLEVYRESKRVLAASLSHQEIELRHQETESLFFKGIVPSALVIEAHRTFVDLEIARNQRELKALSSLLAIYAIDGKSLESDL